MTDTTRKNDKKESVNLPYMPTLEDDKEVKKGKKDWKSWLQTNCLPYFHYY